MCAEWQDFGTFQAWALTNGYADDLTIDRIDSDGNYEPANCQWITKAANTSKSVTGEDHGRARLTEADVRAILTSPDTQVSLAARYGVARATIQNVLARTTWRHVA